MKIEEVKIRNFRRLENVEILIDKEKTVLVGPNNSGKTSVAVAFSRFLNGGEFKIHDFTVSKIKKINTFGYQKSLNSKFMLPSIEMDIWFTLDPDSEFGRVFCLLPSSLSISEKVGIRIKYLCKDPHKLWEEYQTHFPLKKREKNKPLSHYLSLSGKMKKHFSLQYFSLEEIEKKIEEDHLKTEDAVRTLKSLVRVDFVHAQRNIDDQDSPRSTRLSSVFTSFYKKNLEQAECNEEANKVIDDNNERLTNHYSKHFKDLIDVISQLGIPSVNDRQLKLVSSMDPETVLKGNTSLLYTDPSINHDLPEAYNGLGYKNLIYIAIQISHYHLQWINTEHDRPSCQIIFIEEPEVHLHSQVQQVFINKIYDLVVAEATSKKEPGLVPQFCISTHSSHILYTVDFDKVRYFRRCPLSTDPKDTKILNATEVLSLTAFHPTKKSASGKTENSKETKKFLQKYIQLTHCDIFFADAVILIEGAAERLLLPEMIKKVSPDLEKIYLSILEVGGAYAHRFASLLEFIGIPYLVITDLDSVDTANKRKACRADTANAKTSNATIKFFLNKDKISDLVTLKDSELELEEKSYITYQKPVKLKKYQSKAMVGRTFEEMFIYENISIYDDQYELTGNFENDFSLIYDLVKSDTFKKTEFALETAMLEAEWQVPDYIKKGLVWLSGKITIQENQSSTNE